ncbi:inositol phospholipid synthesis and fat-storage-inducing TM-domain-containing protein [Dipodascopsis uninucleata]
MKIHLTSPHKFNRLKIILKFIENILILTDIIEYIHMELTDDGNAHNTDGEHRSDTSLNYEHSQLPSGTAVLDESGSTTEAVSQASDGLPPPYNSAAASVTESPVYELQRKYLRALLTFEQIGIFMIYPTTICLGILVSKVSDIPDNYFGKKTNIFNVFFVKNGWFWTTIVFMIHCIRLRISDPRKLLVRYIAATAWWFLFTQWFAGPPIMDRIFISTGGICVVGDEKKLEDIYGGVHDISSSIGCRHARGEWTGGHDVSGHAFLLTHSSLFLWFEILPVLLEGGIFLRHVNTKIVFGLLAMWWWMLLMTSIYFHTFLEKITGWICGTLSWVFIYIICSRISPLNSIIGVPAV